MCGELYYRIAIAGLWTETALYGLYTAIFLISVHILSRNLSGKKHCLFVSVALYTVCTGLVVMDLVYTLLTPNTTARSHVVGKNILLCDVSDTGAGETAAENQEDILYDLYEPITNMLFAINILVADGLLIYRCLILWQHRKLIIVLPSLLLLGTIVCSALQVAYDTEIYHLHRRLRPQSFNSSPEWNHANRMDHTLSEMRYALTLITNVLTTLLIAVRIWWMARGIEKMPVRTRNYTSAIAMIAESGAIYSTALTITLIMDYVVPEYCTIVYPAMEQLLGITPTLIMVRVGLGKGFETSPTWKSEDVNAIVERACRSSRLFAGDAASLTSVRVIGRNASAMPLPVPARKESASPDFELVSGLDATLCMP